MQIEEARSWAAQAWCTDENSQTIMDVDLAESFAQILAQRVDEALISDKIVNARAVIAKAFAGDSDFYRGYIDNLSCLLQDRYGLGWETANQAARDVLTLLFDIRG